jgi:hypothetical protein
LSVSFHESSVIALFVHNDTVYSRRSDVRIQEKACDAIISVEDVTRITVDGKDAGVSDVAMRFSDDEVLTLDVFTDVISTRACQLLILIASADVLPRYTSLPNGV